MPAHHHQHSSVAAGTDALNEHALAIDALVAELELNTDGGASLTAAAQRQATAAAADKRRSFPTMQTEVALAKANQTAEKAAAAVEQQQQQQQQNGHATMLRHRQQQQQQQSQQTRQQQNGTANSHNGSSAKSTALRPLEQLSELLNEHRHANGHGGTVQRKQSGGGNRAFETINQERLNPSKVDAMARIFGKSAAPSAPMTFTSAGGGTNGIATNGHSWAKRANTTGRIPSNQQRLLGDQQQPPPTFTTTTTNRQMAHQHQQNGSNGDAMTNGKEQQQRLRQPKQPQQQQSQQQPFHSPQIVRGTRAGAKISSARSAAATADGGPTTAVAVLEQQQQRRGDTPTTEPEDQMSARDCNGNGLYDNVQRHRPQRSPGYFTADDCSSLSSQGALPPPSSKGAGGKIGQLIRKLGNVGTGKPPISAASMVSLNRIITEPLTNRKSDNDNTGTLTKSNSLSGEPWKCQVLAQQNGSREDEEEKPHHNGGGIGNRLKHTIFGGMVRRRVPI